MLSWFYVSAYSKFREFNKTETDFIERAISAPSYQSWIAQKIPQFEFLKYLWLNNF